MPAAINGIGTAYRGKRNLERYPGHCEHCQSTIELQTCETRLWFIFCHIPIVPLGRKRIVDLCPRCTHHRAIPLREWGRLKQQEIQRAAAEAARQPDDPEAAMSLLSTLVAFGQHDEATALAAAIEAKFPDHAGALLRVGSWHRRQGRDEQAEACFARALEREPENRAARRAVAEGCLQKGGLAQARDLLAPLEGHAHDDHPAILVRLADAYQRRGEHEDALALYETAIEGSPRLARDPAFRKKVKASEKALGRHASVLPRVPLSQHVRAYALPAVLLLAAIALVVVNAHYASHQTLHIVNSLDVPVSVAIDRASEWEVDARARRAVPVGEGVHRATIRRSDGPVETVDFEVRNSFSQRYSSGNVFVLNVGAAAVLKWERAVHTPVTGWRPGAPPHIQFGQSFLTFRDIDYPFEQLPREPEAGRGGRVARTRVSILDQEPALILMEFAEGTPPKVLIQFAEHYLRRNRADERLLLSYAAICGTSHEMPRCREFLADGLSHRPVQIEWHRIYQHACQVAGDEKMLLTQYDKMLEEEPDSSALLYLRGRLARNPQEATAYCDRAIAADPDNPYPWHAKSHWLTVRGDFAAARKLSERACRLKPENLTMAKLLFDIRQALGEHDALVAQVRDSLSRSPLHPHYHVLLLQLLVASGKTEEAREAHEDYARQVQDAMPEDPQQLVLQSRIALAYMENDTASLLEAAKALRSPPLARSLEFAARLEHEEAEEAEKLLLAEPAIEQGGLSSLLISLVWKHKGNAEKAQAWRQKAVEKLAAGPEEGRTMAAILRRADRVPLEETDALDIPAAPKAALLLALADAWPGHRKELLERAKALNYALVFPHHLLQRLIAAMEK